jgi:hypothetical protein
MGRNLGAGSLLAAPLAAADRSRLLEAAWRFRAEVRGVDLMLMEWIIKWITHSTEAFFFSFRKKIPEVS